MPEAVPVGVVVLARRPGRRRAAGEPLSRGRRFGRAAAAAGGAAVRLAPPLTSAARAASSLRDELARHTCPQVRLAQPGVYVLDGDLYESCHLLLLVPGFVRRNGCSHRFRRDACTTCCTDQGATVADDRKRGLFPSITIGAMTSDELRAHCLSFRGTDERFPFGPETSVFKVAGKIFALCQLAESPLRVSLKCEPALAEQLREAHAAVIPGYHLNKRHWNTVIIDGSLPQQMIYDMVEDSYDLVVSKLPRARQRALGWRSDA